MLYLFAIAAGLVSAIQAGCTGALARSLHNPYLVVVASLTGSLIVIGALATVSGGFGLGRAEVAAVPWWAWLAGAGGAVVLLSQPVAANALGAATYIALVVSSGIVASVLLDHFGALGFERHAAGAGRLAGAALMVAGVSLVARF